ncbi:8-oxoguanine DNA glycosylase OGG fold protein [Streptomyces sp. NPDC004685]
MDAREPRLTLPPRPVSGVRLVPLTHPHSRIHRLTAEGLDTKLAHAVTTLSEHSAEAAYTGLQGLVPGFGPSFYTKFLYFAGKTVPSATCPQPLVLDRSTSPSCRRPPANWRQRVPGHPPPNPTCSNTPCSAPRGREPAACGLFRRAPAGCWPYGRYERS